MIVPTPVSPEMVALTAPESTTLKFSSGSRAVSPTTWTTIDFAVSPGLNVTAPLAAT
jgi:hypothetical protein